MGVATLPTFPGVNFPVARSGPIFDTVVQDALSGKQTAYPKRFTPKWQWTLGYDLLRSTAAFEEMQQLAAFHALCMGRAIPFGYQDAEDNSVTNQQFGIGDGTTTAFQLLRSLGGSVEPVFLPVGVPEVFVNGVQVDEPVTITVDYGLASQSVSGVADWGLASQAVTSSVDYGLASSAYVSGTAGMINFTTPPAAGAVLTWSGRFNWLCRFDADQIDFSKMMADPTGAAGFWEVKKLSFTSVIP